MSYTEYEQHQEYGSRVSGPHTGGYEEYYLLRYNTV
jgi:hypothetical protein